MTTTTSTARNASGYQITVDNLIKQLLLGGNRKVSKTYINVSGDVESCLIGTIMGVIAASGKWTTCKSAAADGSQVPRGIMLTEVIDAADDEEVEGAIICDFGDIDKNLVVFDGTDDWNTLVGGIRMEELLVANSQGIKLKEVADNSEYDN